ncbi:GIY-YIG nuclease family protein [Corynebacterium pilosum]|uniref:GIY-YIG nuclease family protein n=1 Tax=Corynebacterium pilosum TaxID=35756 RepID=UPI00069DC5AF|nr:GIY-YIG nuclease family protein [Corynebacterium pilosum]
MVNPLGEETTLETSSLRLEGIKYDVSELESIAIILRDEETLRGLYRLTFADSFLYAGQSKNVVTRFAQHRRRWDDIVAFEFFPLPVGDLSAAEKLLIGVTERTNSLRNIKDTRRPLGTDEIQISVEEHLSIALPWERSKRVRPQQGINSASTLKFAELSNYDIYPLLRQVVAGICIMLFLM